MRVLIVGRKTIANAELFSLKAFRQLGVESELFDSDRSVFVSRANRMVNKFRRIPAYWGLKPFNEAILKKATEFKPDFILFFKPIFIFPQTVLTLKKTTKVFSWYPDYIGFPRNASAAFFGSIPFYDCHFSFNFANAEELKKNGAERSLFLPCAADPDCHAPVEASGDERKQLGADIVFIGTYAKEKRSDYLERLCRDGYDVKIYGDGWEKHPRSSCLQKKQCIQSRALYCRDLSKILNASKITLAFVREHNHETLACRTYEIPAAGGFMLHQRTAKTSEVLKEGEEAVFFSSYEEMRGKIDFYLKHEEARKAIIQKGRARVLREDLFIHRIQYIIEVFRELE